MVICFVVATKRTTAANAIFIQYTSPVYVALLSWPLLRERVTWVGGIACAGVVVGMVLFFRDGLSPDAQVGNLVAVASSFGAAGLPLALRADQVTLLRSGSVRNLASADAAPALAIALGDGAAVLVCIPAMAASPPEDAHSWLLLAALGLGQIGLPYVLYALAVPRLSALEGALVPDAGTDPEPRLGRSRHWGDPGTDGHRRGRFRPGERTNAGTRGATAQDRHLTEGQMGLNARDVKRGGTVLRVALVAAAGLFVARPALAIETDGPTLPPPPPPSAPPPAPRAQHASSTPSSSTTASTSVSASTSAAPVADTGLTDGGMHALDTRWFLAPMLGYMSDYLDFGVGLRGGKTLDDHIYIGGTFIYQVGESGGGTVATGLGTTTSYSWSSSGFYIGPEGGYDFNLRYVVLRRTWGSASSPTVRTGPCRAPRRARRPRASSSGRASRSSGTCRTRTSSSAAMPASSPCRAPRSACTRSAACTSGPELMNHPSLPPRRSRRRPRVLPACGPSSG